ncbi:MAG: hypothetical protein M3Y82_01260, partial [Verrucomicrobiota bacterium]|nr:hypothetical protein [Verrucomicrobiota bacterium]
TFKKGFDENRFLYFIRNLLNHIDETKRPTWTLKKAAFEDCVNHFTRLGTYSAPNGDKIDVLIIHLRKDTTLSQGRVTLRNFVADYLITGHGQGKEAVIAAFASPQESDWRFSFVKLDFTFEKSELGFVTDILPANDKFLVALLNSEAVFWFYRRISNILQGGFFRFIGQYVEQIPIPAASAAQQAALTQLVDCTLAAKTRDASADVSAWEQQINEQVYQLYALTPEEIQIVEGAAK